MREVPSGSERVLLSLLLLLLLLLVSVGRLLMVEMVGRQLVALPIFLVAVSTISGEMNVYRSDQLIDADPSNSICLFYRFREEKIIYQDLSNVWEDFVEFCFRSIDDVEAEENFPNHHDESFTFEELRSLNKTVDELVPWSTPMDLLEEYQLYLHAPLLWNSTSGETVVYRCPPFWFGDRCQYSFVYREHASLNEIVENEFEEKSSVSCYVHLQCWRGPGRLCLDWREICDGTIDCWPDGIDELHCATLETNECEEDEYRCQNGMCIPRALLSSSGADAFLHPLCLDRSDEKTNLSYLNDCSRSPRFRCDEHACPKHWKPFSCADGQCVSKFSPCANGRDRLLLDSFRSSTDFCSNYVHCSAIVAADEPFCDEIFAHRSALDRCPALISYPPVPFHFGHLTFFYAKSSLVDPPRTTFVLPDYFCYNASLCDCYSPTYFHANLSCSPADEFPMALNISGNALVDFLVELIDVFSSCSLPYRLSEASSLYRCSNSSKFVSKSRIADSTFDCCSKDDEDERISCAMAARDRVECPLTNQCLASIHRPEDCPLTDEEEQSDPSIPFERFCNGLVEYSFRDENARLLTDESECDAWPCRNLYSECDGFWHCPAGDDEFRCGQAICPFGFHPCLTVETGSMLCLASSRMNDGHVDCLGASDEPTFCRAFSPTQRNYRRFRCRNSDFCLSIDEWCDGVGRCPEADDELFCRNVSSSSLVQEILRPLSEHRRPTPTFFSLAKSSPVEPRRTKSVGEKRSLTSRSNVPFVGNCHRGLRLVQRLGDARHRFRCLCPPSSYGARCQYQNQRISLTLQFVDGQVEEIYQIVLLLKRAGQVGSIDRFDYFPRQSCSMKFNRYVLYSTRPKMPSADYFLHLDLYEKRRLEYRGSYFLPVPFEFLPVQRISSLLVLPSSIFAGNCSLPCRHGHCATYLNSNREFCRCSSGWRGKWCEEKTSDCQRCSADSLCLGFRSNRSICLCPMGKVGRRCSLSFSCPPSACLNRGQCLPNGFVDHRGQTYSCVCSKEFYGPNCEHSKAKFDLRLDFGDVPPFVLVHFLTIHSDSPPQWTTMVEKFTLFQRRLTFYLSNVFHLVLIQIDEDFYLVPISAEQKCHRVEEFLGVEEMQMHRYRRLKFFHRLCSTQLDWTCFLDVDLLCLCTADRQANCLSLPNGTLLRCSPTETFCQRGQECFTDHHQCSTSKICICPECFFGDRCQFYAKDFGLTLDEILGYEIQPNRSLFRQTLPIQLSFLFTLLMFGIGLLNGVCSIWTFENPQCHENGCGLYLLVSSITSLLTVIIFTLKFLLLFYSTMNSPFQSLLIFTNCFLVEPALKIFVHLDNWLNGCVAIERARTVSQGIAFEKKQSRQRSKWIISVLIVANLLVFIPHWSFLQLYFDEKEGRTWCVVRYSSSLQLYQNAIISIQFFLPFFFNVFSAIFIIIGTARQADGNERKVLRMTLLKMKLRQHKHLLISPIFLILLSLPRLIISITLKCQKSSKYFLLYLIGYFISFLPSVLLFLIFVLPSAIFKKAFQQSIAKKKKYLSALIPRRFVHQY